MLTDVKRQLNWTLIATVVGLSCVINFCFGLQFGGGDLAVIYALLFASLDVLKSVAPHYIWQEFRNRGYVLGLSGVTLVALCSILSLTSAIGLQANSKAADNFVLQAAKSKVGLLRDEVQSNLDRLKDLGSTRSVASIKADIDALRANPRWTATRACTPSATTARKSRAMCSSHRRYTAELKTAELADELRARNRAARELLAGEHLQAAHRNIDPQATAIATLVNASPEQTRSGLFLLVAIALEIASTFGLLLLTRNEKTRPEDQATVGEIVHEAQATHRNHVADFVREHLVRTPNEKTGATPLYHAYRRCEKNAGRIPLTQTAFGSQLKKLGIEKTKQSGRIAYVGLRLPSSPA